MTMKRTSGRLLIPRSRRLTLDVLHYHQQSATCAHDRLFDLKKVAELRSQLTTRISWSIHQSVWNCCRKPSCFAANIPMLALAAHLSAFAKRGDAGNSSCACRRTLGLMVSIRPARAAFITKHAGEAGSISDGTDPPGLSPAMATERGADVFQTNSLVVDIECFVDEASPSCGDLLPDDVGWKRGRNPGSTRVSHQ